MRPPFVVSAAITSLESRVWDDAKGPLGLWLGHFGWLRVIRRSSFGSLARRLAIVGFLYLAARDSRNSYNCLTTSGSGFGFRSLRLYENR